MKYFTLTLVTALAAPVLALAITNCDDQAVPAMDCPPGYSHSCSSSGGTYHWSCSKDGPRGAIITPTDAQSAQATGHIYQHNQTDLEFIKARNMQEAQNNPLYKGDSVSGVNPMHEGRIAPPQDVKANTSENAWGRVKVKFPWLERLFGGGSENNGLGLGRAVNEYAIDTATGTSTNLGALLSALHRLLGGIGLGRLFNNKWDGTEDMSLKTRHDTVKNSISNVR